ncbi:MAG: RNA-binding S4 domain-containing protein [Thermacetogeniaceae bacterium]
MRLDKFLQVSRLIKRRASANEACDAGRVQLNGRVAKAGSQVKPGDVITLTWGRKVIQVEVLEVPERAIPASQARNTYRLIREEYIAPEEEEL